MQALGSSVWMVETRCPPTTSSQVSCPLQLLESTDGGRKWATVSVPSDDSMNGGEGGAGQTWLIRLSATSAYLASPPNSPAGSPTTAPMWFTSDGGQTWSARRVACGIAAGEDAISTAPDGTLVAVCAAGPSTGYQMKSTVRSSDAGFTWTVMGPCAVSASSSSCEVDPPLTSGYLGEIDAVTADTVFLAGGRTPLLVTHNGGASWATVEPQIGDDTIRVIFFNESDGIVVGYDPQNNEGATIWSTTDGGVTWHSFVPNG